MNICITSQARSKINAFVQECEYEINGLARMQNISGRWVIIDAEITKQTVTGTTAEHDTKDLIDFMMAIPEHERSEWRVQWHSHVNMAVFWSQTDETLMKDFGEMTDHMLFIVFNKKGEYKARWQYYRPFPAIVENVVLDVIYSDDYTEYAKQQIAEKVTKPSATYAKILDGAGGRRSQANFPIVIEKGAQGIEKTAEEWEDYYMMQYGGAVEEDLAYDVIDIPYGMPADVTGDKFTCSNGMEYVLTMPASEIWDDFAKECEMTIEEAKEACDFRAALGHMANVWGMKLWNLAPNED